MRVGPSASWLGRLAAFAALGGSTTARSLDATARRRRGAYRTLAARAAADASDKPVMVISGASYGVGAALARRFVGDYQVCALARGRDKLDQLAQDCCKGAPADLDLYVCDVSKRADVVATCESILSKFARVDVLVNNASVYENKKLQDLTLDGLDIMIDVNLKGTMYLTHCLLPSMIAAKAGKIIMVNSVAGTPSWTIPGETAYCASKHGQTGFASALANEVREHGITVTSLHPGGIDTPLQAAAGTPQDVREQFLSTDDMVAAVEYVLSADPKVLVKTINFWRSAFWH